MNALDELAELMGLRKITNSNIDPTKELYDHTQQTTPYNNLQGPQQPLPQQFDPAATAQTVLDRPAAQTANMADRQTTLDRSRRVDALNNSVYFRGAYDTGGGPFGSGQHQTWSQYQMPQIQTEDSRAQARQREYEQQIMQLPIDWVSTYNQDQFARSIANFATSLGLQTTGQQFNNVMRMAQSNPTLATMLMTMYTPGAVPPDIMSMMSGEILRGQFNDAYRQAGGDWDKTGEIFLPKFINYISQLTMNSVGAGGQGLWQGVQNQYNQFRSGGNASNRD